MPQGIYDNINASATSGNELADILNEFKDGVASQFLATTRDPNLAQGGIWVDSTDLVGSNKLYLKMWTGTVDILIATIDLGTSTVSIAGADSLFTLSRTSADAVGAILKFVKSRIAASGQVQANDVLGEVDVYTTDNAGTKTVVGKIKAIATENSTATQYGSALIWEFVDTGTGSLSEKMRLFDGKLGIGITNPSTALHIKSTTGITNEIAQDSATGSKVKLRKKRVTTNGKVLNADVIAQVDMTGTDQNGAETSGAQIIATATQDHTNAAQGTKLEFKTTSNGATSQVTPLTLEEGLAKTLLGLQTKNAVVGTHATAATNGKLHRGAAGFLQAVLGDDATAEGTKATVLAELMSKLPNYTFSGLPAAAAGYTGMLAWVTDRGSVYVCTGSAWRVVGGGGGGSALRFDDGANPPIPAVDAQYIQHRLFIAGDTQNLIAMLKVPSSYPGGLQIKASVEVYSPDSSGTILMQTVATLIRKNNDLLSSTTNQRTSTNAAVTMTAGLANRAQPIEFDLTDSSGNINSVAVSANDLIIVVLKRGTDTATSDIRVMDKTAEVVIG